jgi:hypothetical protein
MVIFKITSIFLSFLVKNRYYNLIENICSVLQYLFIIMIIVLLYGLASNLKNSIKVIKE